MYSFLNVLTLVFFVPSTLAHVRVCVCLCVCACVRVCVCKCLDMTTMAFTHYHAQRSCVSKGEMPEDA